MTKNVGISRCEEYSKELVLPAMKKAVELAGGLSLKGKKVLIKPNLLSGAAPEKAVTTHPEFLRAAIILAKEEGASEITVGDSPGYHPPLFAAKRSGLFQVTEEEGVKWIDFNSEPGFPVSSRLGSNGNSNGGQTKFQIAATAGKADIILNLPKMKTHQLMFYTGAMKNLFGLIQGLTKGTYHFRYPDRTNFARMIVNLNASMPEVYTIMDGITAMEGPGPGSGYPRQVGLIFSSSNVLALDFVVSSIMGYDPLVLQVSSLALKTGLWLSVPEEITVSGEDPSKLVMADYKRIKDPGDTGFIKNLMPVKLYKLLQKALIPRPVFSKKRCIRCGECIAICPAKALKFSGNKPNRYVDIDYKVCINCYCCHEICPADAITIRRKFLPWL